MNENKHLDRWHQMVRREYRSVFGPFAGKPVVYVEVGTWGGAASEAACRNVLTHPESRGYGIDPYDQTRERKRDDVESIRQTAASRVAAVIGERWTWIREPSSTGLLTLRKLTERVDLLYLDGLHEGPDVVQDFALAWPLLRPGSVVLFDDYLKRGAYTWPHVKEACAAIEIAWQRYVTPIHLGRRQYALRVDVHRKLPPLPERRSGVQPPINSLAYLDLRTKGLLP
jgi:hypothetical protein